MRVFGAKYCLFVCFEPLFHDWVTTFKQLFIYPDANETEQVVVKEDAAKDGKLLDYSENPDGTFEADGITYKYKLGISGRMPNASKDSFFVYLSNLENITFEQAWKAAGFSSISNDYFDVKDAVLVEWRTED